MPERLFYCGGAPYPGCQPSDPAHVVRKQDKHKPQDRRHEKRMVAGVPDHLGPWILRPTYSSWIAWSGRGNNPKEHGQ
jgi:hypothetical protein